MTREMCPAFLPLPLCVADYPGNARARLSILYVVFTLSNSEMPMREERERVRAAMRWCRQGIHSFKVSQIGDLPAVAGKGEGEEWIRGYYKVKNRWAAHARACGRNSLSVVGGKIRADARARAYARGDPLHESRDGWRVNATPAPQPARLTAEYAQGGLW